MGVPIEGRSRELLEAKNFVHLATTEEDGRAYVVPVWFDLEGDLIRVNSAEGRKWPRLVRHDPRVALNVLNLENPYEYVMIHGRVVEDTHEGADAHIDALAKRYLGVDEYPARVAGEQRVIFKIEPESVHFRG